MFLVSCFLCKLILRKVTIQSEMILLLLLSVDEQLQFRVNCSCAVFVVVVVMLSVYIMNSYNSERNDSAAVVVAVIAK